MTTTDQGAETGAATDAIVKQAKGLGPFIAGFVGTQLSTDIANGGIGGLMIPNRIALLDPENN